jgi:hypothetical protein
MKITKLGSDLITIDDSSIEQNEGCNQKIHLIRLMFSYPDLDKMNWVISTYSKTKRFVIDQENIKFYNYFFKRTNVKYYVINTMKYYTGIVSFFKRNNKVLLNTTILNKNEQNFIFNSLIDILSNLEIIMITKQNFNEYKEILSKWNGNVIIKDKNYTI